MRRCTLRYMDARDTTESGSALLTPEDVAQHLRVSEDTLTTWRCTGRQHIPFVKVGRLVRYRPSDVEAYMAGRLQAA